MAGGYRSFQRSEIAEGLSSYFAAPALDTRFLTFRNMMSRHEQWFAPWLGSHPLSVSRSDLGARRSWADPSIYDHEGPRKSLSSRWIEWGVEYRLRLPKSFL